MAACPGWRRDPATKIAPVPVRRNHPADLPIHRTEEAEAEAPVGKAATGVRVAAISWLLSALRWSWWLLWWL